MRRFVAAVKEIYATSLQPSRWPQALQAITDCFGDVGAILIFSKDDGSFGVLVSPRLKDCADEYARDWSRRDVRANRGLERGYFLNRDVITDRDVIGETEMEREPFYNDLLRRHGLKYFACAMVSPDPHVAVGLSVQRSLDKPAYSDAELALLKELGSHVECALRLSIRLMNADLINTGLGAALARIGIGVFILDGLQRVVFSNSVGTGPARRRLAHRERAVDPCVRRGPFGGRTGHPERDRRQVRRRSGCAEADPDPTSSVRAGRWRSTSCLFQAGDGPNQFLASAQAVVLVVDP